MTARNKVVIPHLIEGALEELADRDFQHRVWLGNGVSEIASLNEATAALYDDSCLDVALERNDITFSKEVDDDLRELLKRLTRFQRIEMEIGTAALLELKEWADAQALARSILMRIRENHPD